MGKKKPLHPLHRFIGCQCRSRHARAHESPETKVSVEGDGGGNQNPEISGFKKGCGWFETWVDF